MSLKRRINNYFKKDPYTALLVSILILLIIVATFIFLLPSISNYITNLGDTTDIDRDTDIDNRAYYYDLVEYTDRIYVHKDGDNSTGESWETAYSTFNMAYTSTSADLDDKTIIFIGLGLFDVDVAYQLNITKNIHIVGSGRDATIFTNTHDEAEYILNVSQYFKMENCEIYIDDEYGGIIASNETVDIRLIHMLFTCEIGAGDVPHMLRLYNSSHGEFEDLHFDGEGEAIVGIFINGSYHNHFNDIEIFKCKSGIYFDGITADENHFVDIRIYWCNPGIYIIHGNKQHFQDIKLEGCGSSIRDEIGDSYWLAIYTDIMLALVRPDDLVGIVVTTGGAGVYGADVLIYDASAAPVDVPFYVISVMFEPSSKERYGIRILEGATIFYTTVVEAKSADEVNRLTLENPIILNSQDSIYCSVMSETGGDTVDVWIEIIWLF